MGADAVLECVGTPESMQQALRFALFRFGAEITPGQTHIIWETIGTDAATCDRRK